MREGLGAERYPALVDFLRSMKGLFGKNPIFLNYTDTAVQLSPDRSKPLAHVLAVSSIQWDCEPSVYVDKASWCGQGCYRPGEGGVQLDELLVQCFVEDLKNPGQKSVQTIKKAVQMLVLHEMLHWLLHETGGKSDHTPDRKKDPIYGFEERAYGKEHVTLSAVLHEMWERKRKTP